MKNDKIRNLIKVAKNLKAKKQKQQITDFEEEELKEIYHSLIINGQQKEKE